MYLDGQPHGTQLGAECYAAEAEDSAGARLLATGLLKCAAHEQTIEVFIAMEL